MGYLEDLREQINQRDFTKFLQLWEEYCSGDEIDAAELISILKMIRESDFAKPFGPLVETVLPLWLLIQSPEESYEILKHLIDLQTTNSNQLATITFQALEARYGTQPQFNERIRLVGLRTKENFQSAISNFDLLVHMEKGNLVLHTGGWGVGEIVEVSPIREQLTVEFENISGKKHLNFATAFKTLFPLRMTSFLGKRFATPDDLEKEAKENPVEVIKDMLKELGPLTAAQIKDEMCERVIPEKEWVKWWQGVRARLKKDPFVEAPEALKEPFRLRKAQATHEDRLHKAFATGKKGNEELIQSTYTFLRDHVGALKNAELKQSIHEKLQGALESPSLSLAQRLQLLLLLEDHLGYEDAKQSSLQIIQSQSAEEIGSLIDEVDILAYKKQVLTLIRENRKHWEEIFCNLLFTLQQGLARDYILSELNQKDGNQKLINLLQGLLADPSIAPEFLYWYFQKIVTKGDEKLPFSDKEGQCLLFESLLILLSRIEAKPEYKELAKKIYQLLTNKRYAVVRSIIQGTSLNFIKEFLLLVAKCHSLTDHDVKNLRSLANVVHPSIGASASPKERMQFDIHVLWTTEEGYRRTKERMIEISTVEMVENAREVEAARALGDLRENSEYKFALEKRSRLQGELRHLSEQINRARIITPDDISHDEVGVGSIVELTDSNGNVSKYTILGPWDAVPEQGILSAQSKFAQALAGRKLGETFTIKEDEFTVTSLSSFLNRNP